MPAPPKPGEDKDKFIGRCIPVFVHEGKPQDQAVAICHSMWKRKNENDIINRIDDYMDEQESGATTTGDVAISTSGTGTMARRVAGTGCPKGKRWDAKKGKCVNRTNEADITYVTIEKGAKQKKVANDPKVLKKYKDKGWTIMESVLVGGDYTEGFSNIVGSGQTRAVGDKDQEITVYKRGVRNMPSELGIRFNKLLGAYRPYERQI
jgi:hypothetical protein